MAKGNALEILGEHAALRWSRGEAPTLTASVLGAVRDEGLSPEEVRRVVEHANTSAYVTEFHKEGRSHKVVDFGDAGPADPEVILRHLAAAAAAEPAGDLDDYALPPEPRKLAAAERALGALFAVVDEPRATGPLDPYGEALSLRDALQGALGEIAEGRVALERQADERTAELARHVKEAWQEGATLGDVVGVFERAAPTEAHVTAVFDRILPELLASYSGDAVIASLDKVATVPRMVREEHPLPITFRALCEHLTKIAEARAAEGELRPHVASLDAALKEASLGGILGGVHRAAQGASGPAGAIAEKAVGALVGSGAASRGAGRVAAGLVRHAPLVGAVAAANEVRRHLKYGPTGQALLKHVPGTTAYQMRTYDIAQGS